MWFATMLQPPIPPRDLGVFLNTHFMCLIKTQDLGLRWVPTSQFESKWDCLLLCLQPSHAHLASRDCSSWPKARLLLYLPYDSRNLKGDDLAGLASESSLHKRVAISLLNIPNWIIRIWYCLCVDVVIKFQAYYLFPWSIIGSSHFNEWTLTIQHIK